MGSLLPKLVPFAEPQPPAEARIFGQRLVEAIRGSEQGAEYSNKNPGTLSLLLSEVPASTTAGTRYEISAETITVLYSSHASVRLEVCLTSPDNLASPTTTSGKSPWFTLQPGSVLRCPGGARFREIWIRRALNTPSSSNRLILGLDLGDLLAREESRAPNVSDTGDLTAALVIVRASDSTTANLEGADGTSTARAAAGIAGFDGAAYRRPQTLSAALAGNLAAPGGAAPAAAPFEVVSFPVVQSPGDSLYDPCLADAGAAGAGVQRVVPATIATTRPARAVAGLASSVVLAANARRSSGLVRNLDPANSCEVNWGSAAVVGSHCLLGPGDEVTFGGVEEVHAIRVGGADVAVLVAEESY